MLTQSQKEKLRPFTLHPKFGWLLIDAMITWKTAIPNQGGYGINHWFFTEYKAEDLHYYQFDNSDEKCCLIGAAIVNKSSNDCKSVSNAAEKYFTLQYEEVRALISGFDFDSSNYYSDSEGYIFANQVAKIIFHESE